MMKDIKDFFARLFKSFQESQIKRAQYMIRHKMYR